LVKRIVVLGVVVAVIGLGVVAYAFFKPPEEASGPIEAIPVNVEPSATDSPAQTTGDAVASDPESGATANSVTFEIVPSNSEVRFIIEEVLNGAPKTVVGTTDQIAGEIAINPDDPSSSVIGPVRVNARTLATDNNFRNRALKNRILTTNDYEFITFTPTALEGMPDSVTVGESITFQIIGDLAVRDVTRTVTFDAEVTPVSETQLEGSASAVIMYADFGLVIPEAPAVASVNDDVKLEIDFQATAK
jgi:polyisoprenoid-binding protein YceI